MLASALVVTSLALASPPTVDDEGPPGGDPEAAVATVIEGPYAGTADDALAVCCAAGYCTYVGINECSLLTPAGKVLALVSAAAGGLGGFMGGVGFAVGAFYAFDQVSPGSSPLDTYKTYDVLFTLAFLSGAVGIMGGGAGGAILAIAADWALLQPAYDPRRERRYSEAEPDLNDKRPARRASSY